MSPHRDRRALNPFSSSPEILRAWNAGVADLAAGISAGGRYPWTKADESAAMFAIEPVYRRCCVFPAAAGFVVVEQNVELAFAGAGEVKQRDAETHDPCRARKIRARTGP